MARPHHPSRCDLCASPLVARHDHLFDPATRELQCACRGCAMIVPSSTESTYRHVPELREALSLDPERWLPLLGVPVGIAAVIVRDDGGVVVAYPGPASLVESELDADAWR